MNILWGFLTLIIWVLLGYILEFGSWDQLSNKAFFVFVGFCLVIFVACLTKEDDDDQDETFMMEE